MNLVLIETSGNQNYIFSTNKLRENVGASELTYLIGTKVVIESIGQKWTDPLKLQEFLLDEQTNPPIGSAESKGVEVIIATSGKALLLTDTPDRAREIVSKVTLRALKEMPGLTVHGAIVDVEKDLSDIHAAVGAVHHQLERIRYELPGNLQRFQRLPFTEPCATSGLPASEIVTFRNARGVDQYALSSVSIAKRKALSKDATKYADGDEFRRGRITKLLGQLYLGEADDEDPKKYLPKNLEDFENVFPKTKWLAVIHADGNGLGEIFLNFKKHSDSNDGREYIDRYRKFSIALDICTFNAAGYALKRLQHKVTEDMSYGEVPVLPLVLGGDDLTVLCDGEFAIKFTKDFLEQFERETGNLDSTEQLNPNGNGGRFSSVIERLRIEESPIIHFIADRAFGVRRLGICAGIAIIKPHFPFHQAYGLAESLLKSAKAIKEKVTHEHLGETVSVPGSSLDFHVLYDTSGIELDQIRRKLVVDDGNTTLFAKPYAVGGVCEVTTNCEWLEKRTWPHLATRVDAMLASEKGGSNRRKIPNSQLHVIREALFRGLEETNAEVSLIRHRYSSKDGDKGFEDLMCGDSIFFSEGEPISEPGDDSEPEKRPKVATHFLDALEIVELWKGAADDSDEAEDLTPEEEHVQSN